MIALVDSTKTTGLIFFPGTMVGMLLAGADPTDAVRLQLILLYALLGSVAIAGLVATTLAYRNFFTPAQQLREPRPEAPARRLGRVTRQQRLTLVATILGSTVVFLDGTVVNVALPAICRRPRRRASPGQQWVVEAYTLALVALLLVGGSLGDQFGRRRIFVIGLVAFGATSALCAIAPTDEFLIGARALQGVAGALLVPGSLAIVAATFEGAARGRAVGTWTAWTGIATVLGPAGGGALIGLTSWRAIFWVNLPLIAATVVLTLRAVEESRDEDAFLGIDWAGHRALGGRARRADLRADRAAGARLGGPDGLGADGRRRSPASRLFVLREATRPPPDDALGLFRIRNFCGRQPDHAHRLRRADRRPLLRHPLPPAGRRLLGARGGPGDDADLAPPLLPLAALRPASPPGPGRGCRCRRARSSAASACCSCCGSAPTPTT